MSLLPAESQEEEMLLVEQEAPTPLSFAQAHSAQLGGGLSSCSSTWDTARYPRLSVFPNPEEEGLPHSEVSQPFHSILQKRNMSVSGWSRLL